MSSTELRPMAGLRVTSCPQHNSAARSTKASFLSLAWRIESCIKRSISLQPSVCLAVRLRCSAVCSGAVVDVVWSVGVRGWAEAAVCSTEKLQYESILSDTPVFQVSNGTDSIGVKTSRRHGDRGIGSSAIPHCYQTDRSTTMPAYDRPTRQAGSKRASQKCVVAPVSKPQA